MGSSEKSTNLRTVLDSSVRIDPDIVMRAEICYLRRIGFSDDIPFQKQYFVRAVLNPTPSLERHVDQGFQDPNAPSVFVKQQIGRGRRRLALRDRRRRQLHWHAARRTRLDPRGWRRRCS